MMLTKRGKRRLVVLLAVVIVCGGAAAAIVGLRSLQQERALVEARSSGLSAYESGDYRTALEELPRVIARDPGDLEVVLACAGSRVRIPEVNNEHLLQAVSLYRSALRIDPENREALDGLLTLYRQLSYRTEMTEVADRILRLDAANVPALSAKVRAARLDGDTDEVLRLTQRLFELEPLELSWRRLALTARRGRGADLTELREVSDGWIAQHDTDGRFSLLEAELLGEFGQNDQARTALRRAASLGAGSSEILGQMLSLMESYGLQAEAASLLEGTESRHPDAAWVFEAAARYHWQALRYDAALAELTEAERRVGQSTPGLLGWKAIVLSTRGDHTAAREVADQMRTLAAGTPRDDLDAAGAWGEIVAAARHLADDDWIAAIDAYERAVALRPDDTVLQYLHAQAYQRQGEHDIAIGSLSRLVGRERGWLGVRVALANSLLATGRSEDAFRVLSESIVGRPTMHAGAYLALCEAWIRVDPTGERVRLSNARDGVALTLPTILEQLHERLGWHDQTTRLLAEAYLYREQIEAVETLFDRAVREDEVPVETLLALARVSDRWDLGHGEALIDSAARHNEADPELALARAERLRSRGRIDEAIDILAAARRTAPAESRAADELAWADVRLRLAAGDPDAGHAARELLARSSRPHQAFSLLAIEDVWNDPPLAKAVIDHLQTGLGDRSVRLLLAEAQYAYRCERDDPAAIARALAIVDEVLRIAPRARPALMLRGELQLAMEPPELEEATKTFRVLVETYPAELTLYPPLVRLLQQQGDFAGADRHLLEFAERAGDTGDAARLVVELLDQQGDTDHAARRLARLVDDSSPVGDQLWLASLHARAGNRAEAEAVLERLLEREAPGDDVILAAAQFRAAGGRLDDAVALVESRLDAPSEAARARAVGLILLGAGATAAAETQLARSAALDPDDVETWVALARLRLARGELDRAREAIRSGLAVAPDDATLRAMLAVTEAVGGDGPDDAQVAGLLEDVGAATTPAAEQIVRLLKRLDTPRDQDLADARALVREHPSLLSAWGLAIEMHAKAGRWSEAIDLARDAVLRLPAQAAPAELATRLLIRAGRTDEALEMAYRWRQRSLAAPLAADIVIAALLIDRGRADDAIRDLTPHAERIWDERDRFPDRVEIWLTALLASGDASEAASRLERLLSEQTAWIDRSLGIARALDAADARVLLNLVEGNLATDPLNLLRLALAWNELGGRTGAADDYARAGALAALVERDPEFTAGASLLRASAAADRGDLTLADTLYRSLYTRDPDNVIVLNNLASLIIRRRGDCREALALAERAATMSQDEPSVVDTVALAYLCAGQPAEAETRIRSVLEAGHEHPAFHLTLARVHHAQGRTEDARDELRRARNGEAALGIADPKLSRQIEEVDRLINGQPAAVLSPAG